MDNNNLNQVEDPTENLKRPEVNQPQNFFTNDASQQNVEYSMPQQGNAEGEAKKLKKVKKPWSKGKVAALVSGGAVLVAGIACAVIFILLPMLKPAKDVVEDAFENTFDAAKPDTYIDDTYGISALLKNYYTSGGDVSFTFVFDKIPQIDDLVAIDKYQVAANGSYNPVDKLFNYSASLAYEDKDIIGVDLIGTEDNTYILLDELINGYFKLPNKDIVNKLKSSTLGEMMGLVDVPNYPVNIDYFSNINIASNSDSAEAVIEFADALDKLWDGVDFSKQGKAKINLHDDVVVAMEYYLTFKEEDIEEVIASYFDDLILQAGQLGMFAEASGEFDEETYKAALTQLKAMIPSLISGDLVVRVYIKDGKVVKITSNPKGNIFGVELGCDFSFDITDTHVRLDATVNAAGEKLDVVCDIKCEDGKTDGEIIFAAGGQSVSIKLDGNLTEQDGKLSDTMNIEMFANSVSVACIDMESSFDKKTEVFDGSAAISADGIDDIKLSYSGSLYNVKKGVSFGVKLDNMNISYEGLSLSLGHMDYILDTSKVSAKDIDSSIPVYDIVTLTQEDLEKIANDNQNRIMNWLSQLSTLDIFSAFTSINAGKIEDDYEDDIWDVTTPYDEDIVTDVDVIPVPDATDTDASVTDTDTSNYADIILKNSNADVAVKLITQPQGFEISDNTGNSVTFADSDNCAVGLGLGITDSADDDGAYDKDAETAVDFLGNMFLADEFEIQTAKTILNIDGDDVYYLAYTFNDADKKYVYHVFAKDINAGKPLVMLAVVSDDHLTLDELEQFMSSKTGYELVK